MIPEKPMYFHEVDYGKLSQQLVRAVRGEKSQGYVLRKYSAKTNRISKWENGHNRIRWSEFVNLCKILGVDIKQIMESNFQFEGDNTNQSELLAHLTKYSAPHRITKAIRVSPSNVSRLLSQQTEVRLETVLQMANYFWGNLPNFAASLANGYHVPVIQDLTRQSQEFNSICQDFPLALALVSCCQKQLHQDRIPELASALVADELQVRRTYDRLISAKIVTQSDGCFKANFNPLLSLQESTDESLHTFWARLGCQVSQQQSLFGNQEPIRSFFVDTFMLSEASGETVRKKLFLLQSEINELVREDAKREDTQLFAFRYQFNSFPKF